MEEKREIYEAECMKRLHEEMDREEERRIDAIRFKWCCAGAAFTFVMMVVVELAFRQSGM